MDVHFDTFVRMDIFFCLYSKSKYCLLSYFNTGGGFFMGKIYTGKGVTIATLDTGIFPHRDFIFPKSRIIAFKDFINRRTEPYDDNAHGTHVAGIAAGNGYASGGSVVGAAPDSYIVAVKILDHNGKGTPEGVLSGIDWVITNKKKYNIRVLNLSIGATDSGSLDPLVIGAESAWKAGIVVTTAAGNKGPSAHTITSPGISRKVITVGTSDDESPVQVSGAILVNFSGRGPTSECIMKPDIVAPGADVISCLANIRNLSYRRAGELKIVNENYVKMSGTSMSAPLVAGACACLIEKYPQISPDEVKLALKHSARDIGRVRNLQGWGELDFKKLINEG
jgi:serine protease AprX